MQLRSKVRAGFTLIEMVAVIFIIGILTTFLVVTLGKTGEAAKEKITASYLQQLAAAIAEYESQHGDYPPSAWQEAWNTAPNSINLGAEALVLTLFSGKFQANLPDDRLVNTDNDASQKPLARFPKADLFELKDEWGNPIAYFHRRDYKRQDVYMVSDPATGEWRESSVLAAQNPKTGEAFNPRGFQLISAGVDGEFGTSDDIGNWARPEEE